MARVTSEFTARKIVNCFIKKMRSRPEKGRDPGYSQDPKRL